MKIGIDAHNLEGNRTGVGRYLANLLQQWSKFNDEIRTTNVKFISYFKDEIPDDLPRDDRFELKLLNVGSTAKFVHWDLPRAAKKDGVDILFCPGYIAPIYYSGKIALSLHDIIYEAHPEWFAWKSPVDKILLKWVSKKAARKAEVIFVPSEFTRNEVIKFYGVEPEKIILTYLGVDESLTPFHLFNREGINPPGPPMEGGRDDGTPLLRGGGGGLKKFRINNKFIFFVGSIFSRRHLAEVIEAFGRLAAEKSDYQLFLGGKDHTKEKNIGDLIVRLNDSLSREAVVRVDFIGDSDLKLLYSACAFFIWLSDYEGFGLPPLEAMAAGAPVITSDSTSLKEVVSDAAILIKNNNNVDEIYQAMRRMVEDENLRQSLVEKGKEQTGRFSWKECAEETLNVLISKSE